MLRAVVFLAMSGCLASAHVRGNHEGLDGVGVAYDGPISKTRFGLEAIYERVDTADGRRGVFGYDTTLRLGFVSAILEGRCDEFCVPEPWVEVGPAVGAGVVADGEFDLHGHVWIGGWADIRLWPGEKTYPVLRLELQRDAYSGAPRGDTQVVIGIGVVDWEIPKTR